MKHQQDTVVKYSFEYDEVLEKIGYGKTQWVLLLVSGLLTMTSVAIIQSISIIVLASHCEFKTTFAEKGVMITVPVVGIFLSTYILGYISDAIGRRTVLLYGTFISVCLQFVLMFVTNIWLFNIINLFSGISIAGVSAAIYAYLGEFHIPRDRAIAINYSTMFVSVTTIYVPAIAWLILYSDWSINIIGEFVFRPWRLIILFNIIPGLIGGLILTYYPESPKLLLSQNKEEQAQEAINWISKFNRGLPISEVLSYNDFNLESETKTEESVSGNHKGYNVFTRIARDTLPLFQKPHGFHFILTTLSVMFMFFSGGGMLSWYPEIVNRSSNTENYKTSTVCNMLDSSFVQQEQSQNELNSTMICVDHISTQTYVDNIIVGVTSLIGYLMQGAILKPIGVKNVILASLIISAICRVLIHFVTNSIAILVIFCLAITLPGLAVSTLLGVVMNLVPTNLRGKAVSLILSLGRLASVAGTNLVGVMLKPYCNTTFGILTFVLVASIVMVYHVPIKNSK